MEELQVAREAASQAGAIVRRYFEKGVKIRSKESYNLVSDADVEAEREIARVIHSVYPDHHILGEELHHEQQSAELAHGTDWLGMGMARIGTERLCVCV